MNHTVWKGEEAPLVSFERFVQQEGTPIYIQIIRYVKQGIVAGVIRDGEEMPSRRVLSAMLGVNPNTVQKAYRMLEEEGLLASHTGAKSCISLTEGQVQAVRRELLEGVVQTLVGTLREMGVDREEAAALLQELWDKEGEG